MPPVRCGALTAPGVVTEVTIPVFSAARLHRSIGVSPLSVAPLMTESVDDKFGGDGQAGYRGDSGRSASAAADAYHAVFYLLYRSAVFSGIPRSAE